MTSNKREKRLRLPEGDDGRTIVNMNVEGMPWYTPENPTIPEAPKNRQYTDGLTKKQARMYTAGALKAGLLVASVMSLGIILFVSFCCFVWFK